MNSPSRALRLPGAEDGPGGGAGLSGPRLLGLTAVFCVLVAALLSLLLPTPDSFWRNLWFSECIGLWIAGSGVLIRQWLRMRKLRGLRITLLSLGLSLPVGYVLGYAMAYAVLGEPVRIGGPSSTRIVVLAATVLAAAFMSYLAWLRKRLGDEAQARVLAQTLAAESELRMLRAQLQPHMLFNTLANLRSLVEDEPPQALSMIDLLIAYLRGALAGSRSEGTTLEAEFRQLSAYLEILALRLGKRLRYQLQLPEPLRQAAVPAMLLQPLVENAIKHGIEPKVGGGEVSVTARRIGGALEIVVADTGLAWPPQPPTAPRADGSYGLVHVRERLDVLYGPQASLRLEDNPAGGTLAIVELPLPA